MECEAALVLLWEYLDEELGPEEAEAMASHLSGCPRCRPACCCDRGFLALLARQRSHCAAPPALVAAICAELRLGPNGE
ncbi:MAG: zf-HC2 domain-containing protein [Gemmatimonadales bacterium]